MKRSEDEVPFLHSAKSRKPRYGWIKATVAAAVVALVALAVGLAAGVLVGKEAFRGRSADDLGDWGAYVEDGGKKVLVVDWLDDQLSTENIKSNLKNLTIKPHIAGSEQNRKLAEWIYDLWKNKYKFDSVELLNYSVLLTYPNTTNPNVLRVLADNGTVLYNASTKQEPPLTPGEDDPTVAMPFNAYSGVGNVSGLLVYVNYGRMDDFLYLTRNLSLDLKGRVCIARYGDIFRGNKAKLSQQFGCVGLIIYSDPEEFAPRGGAPVYPKGPNLPPGGLQRGSLSLQNGDPLTLGLPAIDGVFRTTYADAVKDGFAASIPVQPIGYGDAIHFMSQLDSIAAPSSWTGELNLSVYNIWQSNSSNTRTYLEVNNYFEERQIYDVVGTIYGQVEPDKLVVMGNHRDAWVFGAVDPNSGTAVLMEIARVFSELMTKGWRPGRSIVMCSWDAEEYGLIGSVELVQDKQKVIGANAVAYLNVDVAVSGSMFISPNANPPLFKVLWTAAKKVKSPNSKFDTIYDEMLFYFNTTYNGTTKPLIGTIGSGSDFTGFLQFLGVSCMDITYVNLSSGGYPVYHSVHDNFYWMTNFGDPSFTHHKALGLLWSKAAVMLMTTPVLPYDPRDYAITLEQIYNTFVSEYGKALDDQKITLEYLKQEIQLFTKATVTLWSQIEHLPVNMSSSILRIVNNKLVNLERAFILPEGLPNRPYYKHVIFAPSSVNSYAGATFPGVSDAIFNAEVMGGSWDDVRRQLDFVRVHIRYATQILSQSGVEYLPK